jgi:hypothetical protein
MSAGDSCVVNLGPRETRRRLLPGLAAGFGGVALGVVAMQARWGLWPRIAALALIGFGALGILQAMSKT